MRVYTYRFMWLVEGHDQINFKIVSDTEKGLAEFESSLKSLPGIVKAGKEYLHEYDVARIGVFTDILFSEDKKDEKN